MELCNCDNYFDGYGGIYLKNNKPDIYGIYFDENLDNEYKIYRILNDFILTNKNEVNQLFLEYIISNVQSEIKEKNTYINSIKKLIKLYNSYNKVIIRFPPTTRSVKVNPLLCLKQKGNPFYIDNNSNINSTNIIHNARLIDSFIIFVDEHNINLNGQIELHNQYINVIAHELGHSLDKAFDSKRYNDGAYIIRREILAWDKAEAFLNELEIFNTDIKKQKEICVNNYRRHFNYYE